MGKPYTREDVLDRIRQYELENCCMPTLRDIDIHHTVIERLFGSWNNAKTIYLNKDVEQEVQTPQKSALLEKLGSTLSDQELKALVDSACYSSRNVKTKFVETEQTGYFKFIATGDSHIGHNKFREDWWEFMVERGIKENVDFMYHTGDLLEGMSGRPGHVYELAQIGFENQFAKAKELIKGIPFDLRMINGNHDNWYTGKADQGINVGIRLEQALENVIYLGNDEADDVVNGVKIKLWHGNDGASYALSYRTQKFVEQLYGGEKPNILLAGHAHKSIFYQTRNIHIFETGTTCMQTSFMRGKKLAAHTGFWIVEVWCDHNGVTRIRPEWNAFYR